MRRINNIFIIAVLFIGVVSSFAQDVNKVVFVESAFKPNIENAEKISMVPSFSDTTPEKPVINYSVLPSRIDARYKIHPIKPAKLVGSPLDKLYNSRIRLGFGNYTTPLAEFSIQNLRSKEYSVGALVYHKSSHSKLELENGHKVPAGYGINKVSLYGKKFYRNVNVDGELAFNAHKLRYYGYNTDNFPDTLPSMESKDIRQWYSQLKARVGVYSTDPDSLAPEYGVGVIADYFSDDYANSQSHIEIPAYLSFVAGNSRIDINAGFQFFHSVLDTLRGVDDYIVQVNPLFRKQGDVWKVKVGLNGYYSSYSEQPNVFPEAELQFEVVKNALAAYFGVNGYIEINNYSKIASENPYIMPGLDTKNTKHKLIGYGGFKGKVASNAGYMAEVKFSSIEDQYFFVNDTSTLLENTFYAVYDNMEKVSGEVSLWYNPFSYLGFYLRGGYNSYTLETEIKPWYMPETELTFTTSYNFKEKIYAHLDLLHKGKCYAKDMSDVDTPIEFDAIWDLNLRLEYQYSNELGAFLHFYNILAQKYYSWNQYPMQRFNVMAGISYKF